MNTDKRSEQIANAIFNQLGGYNRLNIMIGLKDAAILDSGIRFKIKYAGAAANYVKIQLNEALDLYDVEIGKIRGLTYKVVEKLSGVCADMLKGIIEDTCKVRLSL